MMLSWIIITTMSVSFLALSIYFKDKDMLNYAHIYLAAGLVAAGMIN